MLWHGARNPKVNVDVHLLETPMSIFSATVLGTPRIGPQRELKFAIERYWRGEHSEAELRSVATELRAHTWAQLVDAGLDSIPTNVFSLYDQMLDTTVLVGALPQRYLAAAETDLDRYFAAARGTAAVPPLEMTKWFDTNYHYLVPEFSAETHFTLHPEALLEDLHAAQAAGIPARPVIIGPFTYLRLAKEADRAATPGLGGALSRLHDLLPVYEELLQLLAAEGVEWVQLDEPSAVTTLSSAELELLGKVYDRLGGLAQRPQILVATYFGDTKDALPVLAGTPIDGLALDFVAGDLPPQDIPGLSEKLLVAGVVDGRNVWATAIDGAVEQLVRASERAAHVAVSTSCSLLHVPYTLAGEDLPTIEERAASGTDGLCREWLAFGTEKVAEISLLAQIQRGEKDPNAPEVQTARDITAHRRGSAVTNNPTLRKRIAALTYADYHRPDYAERAALQRDELNLPLLPTTTIGSFPQTAEIRSARQRFVRGELTEEQYDEAMRREIQDVIKLQEDLDIDVLVHGEPERNDMVQYFAEQLEGYWASRNGWVQSYGTRCVRPPVVYGDVQRPSAMSVTWSAYAASLTDRPMKGMLTGPITMLSWSFVRDDQALEATAVQVALAIRDECVDLENAGIRIIQVDEPALRELLPLRDEDKAHYAEWAAAAFRLATAGVAPATQIHTHMCYSEFGEMVGVIGELDADVTSVESARSQMEIVSDLEEHGYRQAIGPGVYDIHSPRVPHVEEISAALQLALKAVPAERLWVNPDCGLKTRRAEECVPSLEAMVTATKNLRAQLAQ